MKLSAQRHIAIIQTAFIGDVALALFMAQELRDLNPDAHIVFVSTPQAAELTRLSAAIDEVIEFDKRGKDSGPRGLMNLVGALRSKKLDVLFALQRSARTSVLAKMSGATQTIGYANSSLSFLYDHRVEWLLNEHETQRNHSLLKVFEDSDTSVIASTVKLKNIPDAADLMSLAVPLKSEKQRVVLAPGSVWRTKRWSEESFVELAQRLRHQGAEVFVTGSLADAQLCTSIAEQSGALSVAGVSSIAQTLSLLKTADLLVTNDSAPTHFAALCGTRTITIYGSTVPEFGFAPRGARDIILENKTLSCRPCGLHGRHKCPLGTMECMTSIRPEMVLERLSKTQ